MTRTEPSLRINVDLTNPGQFFACCGLLELTGRLDRDCMGWFDAGAFLISTVATEVMDRFLDAAVIVIADTLAPGDQFGPDEDDRGEECGPEDTGSKSAPLWIGEPFGLRLDWWNETSMDRAKLKTWSAGQKVSDLMNGASKTSKKTGKSIYLPGMRDHLRSSLRKNPEDWLRATEPIDKPKAFCFDSRLSRNNALDMGHSGGSVMAFSPAVDVLALVGLQRFRPWLIESWTRNRYCSWHVPLSVEVAAVAALGLLPHLVAHSFEFPIKPRDSQGRYKLFGHAQPARRHHV